MDNNAPQIPEEVWRFLAWVRERSDIITGGGAIMDNSDIAAAALKGNGRGKCNCSRHTKDYKPHRACKKCKGSGTLTACLDCGGAGWNPRNNQKCSKCGGAGYLEPTSPSHQPA